MLLKYKSFLVGLVLMLGVALALCISSISARAADATNGESTVTISNNDFAINAYTYNGICSIDYVDQFETGGVYYSTIGSTTDIFLNVSVSTRTPINGQYINGSLQFAYKPTITITAPTGFSLSNCYYGISLVYSSNDDVNASISYMPNNGNATIKLGFSDFYSMGGNTVNLTIAFHITALAQWSGSAPHRPTSIPVNIGISLSGLTASYTASTTSYNELQIIKALEYCELDDVIDELIVANAHMVWSDGVVVYDVADLLYMNFASQNTANSWLDQIAQASHNTENTVDNIAYNLSTDNSGVSSSLSSSVSSLNTGESNVQGQIDDIIADVIGPSDDFNQALDDIGDVNIGAFVNTHTVPLGFWHNITQWFIDTSFMGIFSKFLLIILVLGLVTWILAL